MWQKVHVYILMQYLPNLLRNRSVYYTFVSNSREL